MISALQLKAVLHYDQATGQFTWSARPGSRSDLVGRVAGTKRDDGYLEIKVAGRSYLAHLLAWIWMTGQEVPDEVDHKNGVRSDNRWKNLRESGRSLNMQNLKKARRDNVTGLLGVSPHGSGYRAQIFLGGKRTSLGTFPTPEQAHVAYVAAKRRLHPGGLL